MKKIYFLASMLLIGSAVTAQLNQSPLMRSNDFEVRTNSNNLNQDRAPGDVIGTYSDDFSTPGNWNLANTGSPSVDFTINTVGPGSAPEIISSTSGGNFAWYDCDPQGTGSTVDATLTYGSTFDLSSNPAVTVQFEQFYMDYYEDTYVEVSTNGLAGPWTQYEVNGNYQPNAPSPVNPVLEQVNISSQAGGQANVAVRFHYVGGWGWSWQIDDFALVEAYEHELQMGWAHFSSGAEANDYYAIPTQQITEITFGGLITSNGVTTQTNTVMNVDVDGGTTFTGTSSQVVTLTEGQTDTFSIETPNGWTPGGAGSYDLEISAFTPDFTEQFPANDVIAYEPIVVGGTKYARDNGVVSGAWVGFASYPTDPMEMGNTFEIFGDQQFGKVEVRLTASTNSEGQFIYGAVYKWNTGTTTWDWQTSSSDIQVLNADLDGTITFNLDNNVDAVTGDIYLVCVGHYGGSPIVSIGVAQEAPFGTVAAIHTSGPLYGGQPSAVMVRPIMEPTEVGIEENNTINALNMFPNPANNLTQLSYNVLQENNVALTLTDLSGKIVYTENYGSQTEGKYIVDVSTADLSNGVYFYTLTVGENNLTKKFVVSH